MKKQDINFFRHFHRVFTFLEKDGRIKANHLSMYLILFRKWNSSLFPKRMQIIRKEIMLSAKAGNKTTYSNILQDLHYWGYITYIFNSNPNRSFVEMILFDDETKEPNSNPKNRPDKKTGKKSISGTEDFNSGTTIINSGTELTIKSVTEAVPEVGPFINKEIIIEVKKNKTSSEVTNMSFKKTEEYFGNDQCK